MKHLLTILFLLTTLFASAQSKYVHGAHYKIDSNYSKCEMDTAVFMPAYAGSDTTLVLAVGPTGLLYLTHKGPGGGGGSGTVTSVAKGYGIKQDGTITISGAISNDTIIMATQNRVADTILTGNNYNAATYMPFSDTANTLVPYERKADSNTNGGYASWDYLLTNFYNKTQSGTVTSITAGTGLSGGTITTTGTISMPGIGTAGTYGSSMVIPQITTDAQGRVSGVTTVTVTPAAASITGTLGLSQGGTGATATTSVNGTPITYGSNNSLPIGTGTVTNVIGGTNISITGTSTVQPTVNITGTIGTGNGGTGATATTSVNGTPITYGSNNTVPASANTLTTTTLNPMVINSSLQTVGTLSAGSIPYSLLTGTPTALPPNGSAGGSLSGTYPNPTVATNADLTGVITSVGNATSTGAQTGTGNTFAMSASPTFTGNVSTPEITLTGATTGGITEVAENSVTSYTWSPPSSIAASTGMVMQCYSISSGHAYYQNAIISGGGGGSGSTTPTYPTISSYWDSTLALSANGFNVGDTSIVSSGTTYTLTNKSRTITYVTGTSAQSIIAPVTSTLAQPPYQAQWTIFNSSTQNITVYSSNGSTVLITIYPGGVGWFAVNGTGHIDGTDWPSSQRGVQYQSSQVPVAYANQQFDINGNSEFNALVPYSIQSYTTTTTQTITATSPQIQQFLGSSGTLQMPVPSTCVKGQWWWVQNPGGNSITITSSGGNTIRALTSGTPGSAIVQIYSTTGTSASSYTYYDLPQNGVFTITGAATFGSISVDGGLASISSGGAISSLVSGNTLGNTSSAQTQSFCIGNTSSGFTKTANIGTGTTPSGAFTVINLGTGGASGSTTTVNIGSATGSSTIINGTLQQSSGYTHDFHTSTSSSDCAGFATLSSGTVTVSTTCPLTGDGVIITGSSVSGTTGSYFVSISNATSITITSQLAGSLNTLDNSTLYYVIYHHH